jgi:hypothetical protein
MALIAALSLNPWPSRTAGEVSFPKRAGLPTRIVMR